MYEKQFGLNRRPFRANAAGSDVFVGPQTAKFMAAMKKGFNAGDAVVAVTGEPGVGKTTLVNRAINAVPGEKLVIRFSRMHLGHDEVLEFLLEQLESNELPKSTIKRINLFRDLLAARTSKGTRVIVILEDAVRIGEDALAEFESLTAAGESAGANIVLMGEDALLEVLKTPALRRLNQRTRLRYPVQPLSAGELMAYMKHCFRNAGAEFDLLFEKNAAGMLFELSGGNPRVANNLVESILTATAEQNASKVSNQTIALVARDELGLTVSLPQPEPEVASEPEPAPVPEPEPAPEPVPEATLEPEPVPAPEPEPEPEPEPQPDLTGDTNAIPELIQDTLPDLEVLAPGLAAQGIVVSPESEPAATPDAADAADAAEADDNGDDEIPTLFSSGRMVAPEPQPIAVPDLATKTEAEPAPPAQAEETQPPAADSIPELGMEAEPPVAAEAAPEPEPAAPADAQPEAVADWDRDPTLAELRPDIEALEQAMADFEVPAEVADDKEPEPVPEVVLKDPTLPGVPEITLDVAIEQKISEAQEALEKTDGMIPESAAPEKSESADKPEPKVGVPPLVNPPPVEEAAEAQKADTHIEKIAQGLAAAKSIDDVDDQMAETLFGAEFSLLAEEVVANAPDLPANDPKPVAAGIPADQDNSIEEPAAPAAPASAAEAAGTETAMEQEFKEVYGEDALEVSIETNTGGGLDISASQRLATVRALNADKAPVAPASNGATTPAPASAPEPIEDQINTSMTATLKALSKKAPAPVVDDDDDGETKSGFFSRFKRS